jgi:hypothetical protein
MSGQLTDKGGRYVNRGWRGAKYVKRQTAKHSRRIAREAIRDNDGEVLKPLTKGWEW